MEVEAALAVEAAPLEVPVAEVAAIVARPLEVEVVVEAAPLEPWVPDEAPVLAALAAVELPLSHDAVPEPLHLLL